MEEYSIRNRLNLTLLITIFLVPVIIFGQNHKRIIKDFNKDGYKDTLESYYDGGTGVQSTDIRLINGKTKEIFELNNTWGTNEITYTILIPPELVQLSNKPFLEAIKKALSLPARRNFTDASLQWIISANINQKKLSDNSYYDLLIKTPPQWISGKIELPNHYYIDVSGDTLEILNGYNSESNEGWLVYFAGLHYLNESGDSLLLVDASPTYKVFRTSHGVVVTKGNLHTWVFVSDVGLTGGLEKIWWESINNVTLIDKYIVLQVIGWYRNPIFIIDVEKGIFGRLRHYNFSDSYIIDKDNFIIESNTVIKIYKLQELFN